nr:TlpA disulfide reductase family protein [Maliibacterium massiliense]
MRRARKWIILAMALLLALCGCGPSEQPAPSPAGQTAQARTFPPFTLRQLGGGQVQSAALFARADITMLHIWASWCAPCVDELPDLQQFYVQALARSDCRVQVVGIAQDYLYNPQDVTGALEQAGVTFPTLLADEAFEEGYLASIYAYPTTIFVDKSGRIVGKAVTSTYDSAQWTGILEAAIGELAQD